MGSDWWDALAENACKKPRQQGLTVVIDKGLPLSATEDFLKLAAPYIDFIKFGFGTALLYTPKSLRTKLQIIAEAGVFTMPGGTLFELAVLENRAASFFDFASQAGFTHIEVSDGTIDLCPRLRRRYIRQAIQLGFGVLSEIGKKDPDQPLDPERVAVQAVSDLEAGATKVIIEGRDSGRDIGVYDEKGTLRADLFEQIVDRLPCLDDIIWEAPRPRQQKDLLARLGPATSFGNVQPEDVFTLAAMRRGLRGDTLRLSIQNRQTDRVLL